jgi:hypothetical protein
MHSQSPDVHVKSVERQREKQKSARKKKSKSRKLKTESERLKKTPRKLLRKRRLCEVVEGRQGSARLMN